MKISVAKSAGFCFGVKRALEIAYKAAERKNKVYMLGDIVHNEDVVKEIIQKGIRKTSRLKKNNKNNKTLLIRAHGASLKTFKTARALGYKIINATCPMVKEIHKIAKRCEKQGYTIIIIGDNKHDEVQGITGQLRNKSIVIDSIKNIPTQKVKRLEKAAIVAQSTQNIEKTLAIVELLKKDIRKLKFFNTICKPTQIKQKEIKTLPLQNDIVIIIGSKASANTRRLYELSKSINKKSYWINSKKDLNIQWFKNIETVGITAGASTPDRTTIDIIEHIKKIS